ncbi:flagellar basal body rod protein FlgB [Halobacillus andaensis]|uniref:flagellar basal body rod protein FlgB n=1 Tax=Halobacillus andaensis TaxID=1176239 RepID=UPI003D751B29
MAFKDVLNGEMKGLQTAGTDERHLPFEKKSTGNIITTRKEGTTYNHNGNNVDIDKEMNELAKNQIQYQALVDRMSGKFSSLKSVIQGGN